MHKAPYRSALLFGVCYMLERQRWSNNLRYTAVLEGVPKWLGGGDEVRRAPCGMEPGERSRSSYGFLAATYV